MCKKTEKNKSSVKRITQFEIIRSNVAGIDVSSNSGMMVSYPINETEIVIEEFECYTRDLHRLSQTLKSHHIESVAMESTGIYWVPLFLLLQDAGFEVYLVNAKHVKNVTGRKNDESDAEWIQKLHRCGLLSASFQPDNQTRELRSVVRHRDKLVKTRTTYINRIQKSLDGMNLKIHNVISDISGKTGQLIIKAILNGERDAQKLAQLRDPKIRTSHEELVKSLEGFWSEEHLFELEQNYSLYTYHDEMIEKCDQKIEKILQQIIKSKNNEVIPKLPKLKRKRNQNNISIDVTNYLYALTKVDVASVAGITGISEVTALGIYAEIGDNLYRFKNEKHFVSWLGLAPNTKISGGKIISSSVPKKKHSAGQYFRLAAMGLCNSKGALGDYYRTLRNRIGYPKAIVALARKIAVIYFQLMTKKKGYDPQLIIDNQEKYKERKIKNLEKYLTKLKNTA